jgi:NAD(P)-dependent dehydrogenase (short-subunit alcohol dehydrogenase family)
MQLQLEGKGALVTGSSAGLGEGIARVLAAEGAAVVIHGRDEARARAVAAEINAAGGKAEFALGDIAHDADVATVFDKARSFLGSVDILVNNAGIGFDVRGWDALGSDEWTGMLNTNVVSVVRFTQLAVPMMKAKGWGRIIMVSSIVALEPHAQQPHYSASKAAMLNMTVSLAKQLAGTGITVNAITPGAVMTPGFEKAVRSLARQFGWGEDWDGIVHKVITELLPNPTGRLGTTTDVGNVVAFLASPLAGYINGADVRIDGGSSSSCM